MALQTGRWDLFDLLLEWGADLKSVDVYTVLNTYNAKLYERFRAAGYDLTERHEMAAILGHSTRNRPLLGFVKRHRCEDPKIQQELPVQLPELLHGSPSQHSTSQRARCPRVAGTGSGLKPAMTKGH